MIDRFGDVNLTGIDTINIDSLLNYPLVYLARATFNLSSFNGGYDLRRKIMITDPNNLWVSSDFAINWDAYPGSDYSNLAYHINNCVNMMSGSCSYPYMDWGTSLITTHEGDGLINVDITSSCNNYDNDVTVFVNDRTLIKDPTFTSARWISSSSSVLFPQYSLDYSETLGIGQAINDHKTEGVQNRYYLIDGTSTDYSASTGYLVIEVTENTGIENLTDKNTILIRPTIFNDYINVVNPMNVQILATQVLDVNGKVIYDKVGYTPKIYLPDELAHGVYTIILATNKDGLLIKKLMH